MKPAPFKYHDPQSLSELLDLTATLEDAKILAGGQSLMPMMNMRFVTPDDVVDINNVSELDFIESKQGHLRIGSMTRQREIVSSKKVSLAAPIIGEALLNVGHLQTRNRGTLGGSLCHLDPAAESISPSFIGVSTPVERTYANPVTTRKHPIKIKDFFSF